MNMTLGTGIAVAALCAMICFLAMYAPTALIIVGVLAAFFGTMYAPLVFDWFSR